MQDFERVYVEQFDHVRRYALSLCRDEHLAEEIAQQALFKAAKAIERFDGRCSLRAWLCQIAKHSYFDHLRRSRRLSPLPDAHPEGRAPGAEAELLSRERQGELHRALHGLPEPYREVFSLRVFAELPHDQIARVFEKSESWSRVTYHRARLMLMDRIGRDEDE